MKIVFLDRDGVINKYPGDRNYVTTWKNFRFLPGVKKSLKKLVKAKCRIFVVSNQAGVIKGIYSQKTLDEITRKMLKELAGYGVSLDKVYYCIHRDQDNCSCRKPKIGMLMQAIKEHGLSPKSLKNSFFVGDTTRDILTGRNAGCKTILVFSGKEKLRNKSDWGLMPDFTAKDLAAAADIILSKKSKVKSQK